MQRWGSRFRSKLLLRGDHVRARQPFIIFGRVNVGDGPRVFHRQVLDVLLLLVLEGKSIGEEARQEVAKVVERTIDQYTPGDYMEDWDMDGLFLALGQFFQLDLGREDLDKETVDRNSLTERIVSEAMERYQAREDSLGEELMGALERFLLLQIIDERWRE